MKKSLPLLLLLVGVCPAFAEGEEADEIIAVEEDDTGEEPMIGLRLADAAAIEMTALDNPPLG
ncbi:MAG: hypothetical protein LBJ89_04780 [Holosporales bacterium]|nr:hypothetical protein [Holosporales bacterium]